jgi:hypothetical protein
MWRARIEPPVKIKAVDAVLVRRLGLDVLWYRIASQIASVEIAYDRGARVATRGLTLLAIP